MKYGGFMKKKEHKEIIAYKAFNEGLTNRYEYKFELGRVYRVTGDIKWGINGNGFHMCQYFEDCFRYFDSETCELALVRGFGEMQCYDDEYFGYYDMYVCEGMEVLRILSHSEIIELALDLYNYRIEKFIKTFKLTDDEIKIFKKVYGNNEYILDYISYYQENDEDAFVKRRGVINGRNNC